ncbi:MAG: hypothetical protein V1818_02495 [Candidatus Aenigmatarchaeota archaeon]
MEKRYIMIILALSILVIAAILYFLTPSRVLSEIITGDIQTEENESERAARISQNVTGNETGAVSEGGGGTGGTGGSEDYTVEKVNYTISVDSQPEGLGILVNYSMNSNYSTIRKYAPYSVEAESGTEACVLLTTSVKGGSVVTWDIDGEDCVPSICAGFMGCSIFMDMHHTAIVYYSTPG